MASPRPPLPRYGDRSLAEVVTSLLSGLGLPGFENRLGVRPCRGFCLLVIDGLGWEQLLAHRDAAPFMCSAAERSEPLTAGFPSTTAASLGSLGTGLPPGEHGLVGYTFAVPGRDRPMNALLWQLYGIGPRVELGSDLPPEEFQPVPTALERAQAAGAAVTRVGPPPHEGTPFTRAILRGGRYVGAYWDHEVAAAVSGALRAGRKASVFAYHPDLDTAGHSKGVGSDGWLVQLRRFEGLVEDLAGRLRSGEALFVTGDHGMVDVVKENQVDVGDRPELMAGVRMLGGEPRARHVYAVPGAEADVLATWREALGSVMWVLGGEEAVEAGWFGPRVTARARRRVGDVVAAAHDRTGVFQRDVDPLIAGLIGQHGSMTAAEQLVPLLEWRG